ncbi:MAG: hypothetical protein ACI865_002948 [Flavobacteriaceae bacterium]|jgi:hypothetical protein
MTLTKYIIAASLILLSINVFGQGFFVQFGDTLHATQGGGIYQHTDSTIYVSGFQEDDAAKAEPILYLFDQFGVEQWSVVYQSPHSEYTFDMVYFDQHLYLTGQRWDSLSGLSSGLVLKIDLMGNLIWRAILDELPKETSFRGITAANGKICSVGYISDLINGNNNAFMWVLDTSGAEIWRKEFKTIQNSYAQDVVSDGNNFYVTNDKQKSNFDYSFFVASYSMSGDQRWCDTVITPYNTGCQNLELMNDELWITGESSTAATIFYDPFITRADTASGAISPTHYLPYTNNAETGFDLSPINDDQFYFTGYGWNAANLTNDIIVGVADTIGTILSTSFYGFESIDIGFDIIPAFSGGKLICGETRRQGERHGALIHVYDPQYLNLLLLDKPEQQVIINTLVEDGIIHFYNSPAEGWDAQLYSQNGQIVHRISNIKDSMEVPVGTANGTYILVLNSTSRTPIAQRIVIVSSN